MSMRFTGVAAATHASMTGAWLTDNRRLDKLEYDSSLVRAVGVPGEKLPPLRPSASVIGVVQASVAAELGLGPDVKVVAGTPICTRRRSAPARSATTRRISRSAPLRG